MAIQNQISGIFYFNFGGIAMCAGEERERESVPLTSGDVLLLGP